MRSVRESPFQEYGGAIGIYRKVIQVKLVFVMSSEE
jgi:hypothetical protein